MTAMIQNPEAYFARLIPKRAKLLIELEKEAEAEEIPIVGPVVGELLYVLAGAVQARSILELGTATGYSTIYLASACEAAGGRVVTFEMHAGMAGRARANLRKAGLDRCVEIVVGDALEKIAELEGFFDLVFLDIDKADYIRALPHCLRLIRKGGLLVADNVAFKEADDFNRAVYDDPRWRSVHLLSFLPLHSPQKDGLCLALRT